MLLTLTALLLAPLAALQAADAPAKPASGKPNIILRRVVFHCGIRSSLATAPHGWQVQGAGLTVNGIILSPPGLGTGLAFTWNTGRTGKRPPVFGSVTMA